MMLSSQETTRVLRRHDKIRGDEFDDDLTDTATAIDRAFLRGKAEQAETDAMLAKREGCNKLAALIRRQQQKAKE